MEILAFDIGGTQGRCCRASLDGKHGAVTTLQRGASKDGREWLDRLIAAGRELTAATATATSAPIRIVSVSFGGPVANDGKILSMHVAGWESINLGAELERAFAVPVLLENDANAGAVGEFTYGAGRGFNTMAYFTVSTGIGGGVILNGKLYRGPHGMAAEFGQFILDDSPAAPQYATGKRGNLEALACGPGIAREGRAELQRLGRAVPENFSAKTVFDAARNSEDWAVRVRDTAAGHLARGVAAVICAYDLERVVIGGGVSLAGETLFAPLREKVEHHLPHFLEGKCSVVPAALGDYAALLGAVGIAAAKLRA
jgi:glucokinase